ncbi:MAG: OpgC domain-containing protein [Pseudomonadota bacterium]
MSEPQASPTQPPVSVKAANTPAQKKPRDVRLDFFRGVCLIIIFIAHTYGNPWAQYIPARFGFSDATEIFVFCSGMASAIAFGSVFARRGALVGFGRVSYRIWQVYWAHISLFMVAIAMTIVTDDLLSGDGAYFRGLQFHNLFNENAPSALLGLMTLTWVPPYFDILPMYLIILCMMPFVILAASYSKPAVAVVLLAIWFSAQAFGLAMPSVPWAERVSWFFNPFGWQLIFFIGFAFMRGWIPAPPRDPLLIWAAIIYCAVTLPLEWEPLLKSFDTLADTRQAIAPLIDKGRLGILRMVHFLALAYLAYIAVGENGHHLRGPVVNVIRKIGQQSLGIFMAGIVLSFVAGPFMNAFGRTYLTVFVANAGGIAILIAIAYTVAWYKSAPWSKPAPDRSAAQPTSPSSASHVGTQPGT